MSRTRVDTARQASAEAIIVLSPAAFAAVMDGSAPKGDVLAAARIAGIMAAKKVPELIRSAIPSPSPGRKWNSSRWPTVMPSASSPP